MNWVRIPAGLSNTPEVLQLERTFGLAGYARLLKMLELLASAGDPYAGRLSLLRGTLLEVLQAQDAELTAFLECLAKSGLIRVEGAQSARPTIEIVQVERFLPEPAPVLPTRPDQWALWLQTELNMSRPMVDDPYAVALFRRWIASNVTVTEMNAAVAQAVSAQAKLTPTELHARLHAVRTERLAQARS